MHSRKLLVRLIVLALVCLTFVVSIRIGLAQTTDTSGCPEFVQKAMADLDQNCGGLDRNSACYGFNRVNATFAQTVADTGEFSKPADRSGLADLDSIATAPLDVSQQYWGIAVLNVQANIPDTVPGQAVTFILLGDVQVGNAVSPDNAFQPAANPINVSAVVGANIRSLPTERANVIGSFAAGDTLPADALSSDSKWVRVPYESGPGWVSRDVIKTDGDLSTLPVITQETESPMQAFTLKTGGDGTSCNQAPPSLLVVQGPEHVKVDITANGANIQIGSTIVLRLLEGNKIQLIVVAGHAQLGNLVVPAGFTVTAPLSEDGKSLAGDWSDFRPLTQDELDELNGLQNLPADLLHYPIVLPTEGDIQEAMAIYSRANNSDNGSEAGGPAAGQADCSTFKPTSPLDGLAYGVNTFYWDGAQGATSYRVNVYDESGALKSSFDSDGTNLNLQGDTSDLGNGFTFSWEVQALVNGQVACTSNRVTMFRSAPPGAAPARPTPVATEEQCGECEPG